MILSYHVQRFSNPGPSLFLSIQVEMDDECEAFGKSKHETKTALEMDQPEVEISKNSSTATEFVAGLTLGWESGSSSYIVPLATVLVTDP